MFLAEFSKFLPYIKLAYNSSLETLFAENKNDLENTLFN